MSRPWHRLVNPSRRELEEAQSQFGLHPLVIGDLGEGRQQPKFESFDEHLYLSIWDVDRGGSDPATTNVDLALVFNDEMLLLVQRGDVDEMRDLEGLLAGPGAIPIDSPIAAVHRVLDAVVHDFVELAAQVEDDLDELETEVFDSGVQEDYQRIYRLRQRIGRIDRAATGLAEALRSAHQEIDIATAEHPELRPYFRHLELDASGVAELSATEHASLDVVVSSHESNVATRQNRDMRTISAFAALLAIPTVIGGLYGMNFKNLPLLQWEYGWVVVAGSILVLDLIAYVAFRHRGWLGDTDDQDDRTS
ncbi:magnesium transporter CorA family protein [Microbacterium aurantiacum]|uniref:magnesium transporter CorA family protein n=1 Tax=Microbacterium aurantiacum TaxID=162393 RepID=UPI000C80DC69|nr:CorA family divalent cation transporter [Microbacterium aurantiacum]